MRALKRYRYHLLATLVLLGLLFAGARTRTSALTKSVDELPKVKVKSQINHALELFAGDQSRNALNAASTLDMREFILSIVKQSLPAKYEDRAYEISRAVIVEANHHRMDPLFLLAVITTESKFNVQARGAHGEIGLMQVLPRTAKWLAPQAGLPESFDLQDPAVNIRLGATYFAHLRHKFSSNTRRYIGAYNMGVTNVHRLLRNRVEPQVYPSRVLNNYTQIYSAAGQLSAVHAITRGLASTR